ncbi:MAG: DEAD/DEAH box helicase family protein [Candidatus Onthovivens sp.]|nr:DEAD/DEAH box helicase family protein [Candidatus Onthovivens sp.]
MKSVFEINNYREACKFLQKKYDKKGFVRKDYYHVDPKDGHLIKTSGVGHGKDGLQYHHICEDIVPSLSDKNVAANNDLEYQKAENMCYCNLLEHAWLHILITENNTELSDNAEEAITGQGGVRWMILALNSIMCNANISYYSSVDDDGHGCNYNVNNIITKNKDAYNKIINRYCTSAFIRQRLGKSSEELAEDLCLVTKRDIADVKKIIDNIMEVGKNTYLFDWNVNAYADLENYLRKERTALVWICTGGGKTTTGLEYLRVHECNALVLCPSNTVKDSWTSNKNCEVTTYQTFMNDYASKDYSKYGVIICDEVHHAREEAPRWSEGLQFVLDNTNLKIIGLTATPTNEQLNGTDKYFGGRICMGLDLAEGMKEGYIHLFDYIQSIYKMEDARPDFEKYGEAGTTLWGKLNIELNKYPVANVLRTHMPEGQRKIIVFCSNIEDIQYAIETMKEYQADLDIRDITSKKDKKYIKETKNWFNTTTDHNVCLVTVGMVNEGAHYEGVNTLVMFRRTKSSTLYLQQLGRVIVTTRKPNPHGIVFDFTNNADNLINNQFVAISYDDPEADPQDAENQIKKIKQVIKEKYEGKEIIYKDYTNDCVNTLRDLQEAKNVNLTNIKIYKAFDLLKQELMKNEFAFDLWKDLKIKDKNLHIQNKKRHAKPTGAGDSSSNGSGRQVKSVPASDVEKLAQAFKVSLRRLYNFGIIDFDDTNACDAIINDEKAMKEQISLVGFKSVNSYKEVLHKLGRTAYILTVNLN